MNAMAVYSAIGLAHCLAGCRGTDPALTTQIKLVVPVGFRGGILVSKPEGEAKDKLEGTAVVSFDGRVTGDQANLFYGSNGFTFSSTEWSDGSKLQYDLIGKLRPEEVGLRDVDSYHTDAGIWYFVGTQPELQKFMSSVAHHGSVVTNSHFQPKTHRAQGSAH